MSRSDTDILAAVRESFAGAPPARLGVAVSGGSDSVALLHVLTRCFEPGRVELMAATVDHGLRAGAAREAADVAALAGRLGVEHSVLSWRGWDGRGNLQDRARQARYRLLSDWAKARAISVLALGHTADDQAETVLMRLARASGVTGLAAMPVRRTLHGTMLVRPVLGLGRDDLRAYLRRHGLAWAEDPSNDDPRFERVRARQALATLAPAGLTPMALAGVARNMAQAREALDWYAFLAARDIARIDGGDVLFDLRGFRIQPEETARRLLLGALGWIGGAGYPPRRAPVEAALEAIRAGRSATLGGCRVLRDRAAVRICREYGAVRSLRCPADEIWDRRWRLSGGAVEGCELRPLGRRGLEQCPGWRDTGRPHAALLASPSVWRGTKLVAAPLAGLAGGGWGAELAGGPEEFFASLLSH